MACRILVPRPGIEPVPHAVEARSPNHWTAREVPIYTFFVRLLSLGVVTFCTKRSAQQHNKISTRCWANTSLPSRGSLDPCPLHSSPSSRPFSVPQMASWRRLLAHGTLPASVSVNLACSVPRQWPIPVPAVSPAPTARQGRSPSSRVSRSQPNRGAELWVPTAVPLPSSNQQRTSFLAIN